MRIQKLALRRMRNNNHFQVHTTFIDIVNRFGAERLKIKPIFDRYMLVYRKVDAALKKINKSIITEQIQDADRARDEILLGFLDAIAAGLRHFNPEIKLASKKLKIVTDTYGGKNIARLPFNEQTSAVYNLLQDLNGIYAPDVTKAGLGAWVIELRNLNAAFDTLMLERYDEEAAKCNVVLKEARAELDKLYNAMIDCINAFIALEGITDYEEFVRTWNVVIIKYRSRKHHAGSSAVESEDDTEEALPEDSDEDELETAP